MPSTQIVHDKYLKDKCSFKKLIIRMLCFNADEDKAMIKSKDGGKVGGNKLSKDPSNSTEKDMKGYNKQTGGTATP